MSDATITHLVPRTGLRPTAPRDCGVARVIALPERPTGRIIEPLAGAAGPRIREVDPSAQVHSQDPGPLVRALLAMDAR
jgi:hypothetical protein